MRLETYQHLVDILETSNTPMSTQEIATKIQLSRSVTSLYLNKLLEKVKSNKREKTRLLAINPCNNPTTDVFRQYIGSQGSAKKPSNNAKPLCCIPIGYAFINPWSQWRRQKLLAKLIYEYLKTNKSSAWKNSIPLTVPIMPIIPNCYHLFSSAIPKAHSLGLNQKNKDSWPKLIIPYSF